MIVECNNCQTRFQLDDSRVPLRGIRVRCSRCKEAFFLEHPDASKADALDDVASEAAAGGPAPDSTQDLPPDSSLSHGAAAEPEEEDWEFNDQLPGADESADSEADDDDDSSPFGRVADEGDDFDAAAASVSLPDDDGPIPGLGVDDGFDDDDDEGFADAGSGLDLDGGDAGSPEPSRPVAPAADAEQSDFGEASDFSALADDGDLAGGDAPGPSPGETTSQDGGQADDWDFFSDESLEHPAGMDDARGRAMQAAERDEAPRRRAVSRGPALGNVPSERGSRFDVLQTAGRALGWAVTLGLFGIGVARGVFHVDATTPTPSVAQFGDFRAVSVGGRWLDTVRSTQLYAVSGRLVNVSRKTLLPGEGLTVALRSPDGHPLGVAPAHAGLALSEQVLREASSDELARASAEAVRDLSSVRLEPGEDVRFLAFFDGVPDAATGYVLEMGRSAVAPPDPGAESAATDGGSPRAAKEGPPSPGAATPGTPGGAGAPADSALGARAGEGAPSSAAAGTPSSAAAGTPSTAAAGTPSTAAAATPGTAAAATAGTDAAASAPALTSGTCCSPASPAAPPSPAGPASPETSR